IGKGIQTRLHLRGDVIDQTGTRHVRHPVPIDDLDSIRTYSPTSATVVATKPTRNNQVKGFDVSNSARARTAEIRISTSMKPATCSRTRIALHRRSHHAPTPATPS